MIIKVAIDIVFVFISRIKVNVLSSITDLIDHNGIMISTLQIKNSIEFGTYKEFT